MRLVMAASSWDQWLAGVIVRVQAADGRPAAAFKASPITGVQTKAYEELIAAETRKAEQLVAASTPGKPGIVDGVHATLQWAGRRSGRPPIEVSGSRAS